ncbi:serine/threonine-protein kinase [Nonomuraea sp. NPDC049152]|uniref:serine/threonine-protein kinase n=1 Tax=Nonomuraea sp. NPDC049152 TaxID=3154350 RepID=UPI0033EC8249
MEYVLAGRYRLAERLGEGGAGTVWRARDERLGRDVALKQVRIPQQLDAAGRQAFVEQAIHEARSAGRLRDPSIVMVHDVVLDQGLPWIVMDLATGRSLDRIIKESGPLPPHIVARIGLQVLSALEVAHAHGILHQDVKPANILLDADGTAMLTDFGVAAPVGGVGGGGSPGYMPPERLNGLPAGPASDLFSLGASLYTAVEGHAPFHRETQAAVAAAVLLRDPPPPERAGRDLGRLILDLLAKQPERRPHPREARERLTGSTNTAPVAYRPRRRWKLPTALAVAAVAAVGGVTYAFAVPGEGERGRFADVPDACALLTDAQAKALLGGAEVRRNTPIRGGCVWEVWKGSHAERSISLRLAVHRPQGGHDGPQVAKLVFDDDRAAAASSDDSIFRKTTYKIRDVQGVGEAAFAQDSFEIYQMGDGDSGQVWYRVASRDSNLTAEIVYNVREVKKADAVGQRVAVEAARQVTSSLRG